MAGILDNLAQLFQPTQPPMPDNVTLTPPAPVKPSVAMVRPRISPANLKANTSTPQDQPGTTTVPGSSKTTSPQSAGSSKSGAGNFLSDTAGGLLTVPQNADAISAFAYGFAGSIKSGEQRKLADKNAAIAAEDRANAQKQQQFNNDIAIKNSHASDLVDDKGAVTPLGRMQIDKDVTAFATQNGLNGKTAGDRQAADATAKAAGYPSATAMLDDYRKQREAELLGDYGHDTLRSDNPVPLVPAGGMMVPRADAVSSNVRPGEEGVQKGAPWNPFDQPHTDYPGNPAGRAPATQPSAASAKAATVKGSGTTSSPYTGFTSQDDFDATVKVGDFYINPADGRLLQRVQ